MPAGLVLPAVGEPVLPQRVGLGREAFGIVRIAGAGDAADAVHVAAGHDIPEVVGDPVIGEFPRVAERLQRPGDLRDMLVGVLAADRIDVLGQAVLVIGVAVEDVDVVEQLGAFEELPVAGEPGEARHHLVHAAVLAGDIAAPHADARLDRQGFEPGIDPGAHVLGDLEGLRVAADLVAIEQAGEDLVEGVIRSPDLGVLGAVRGPLLEHDELIGGIGADETPAPVPVIGPDAAGPEVGIIALAAGAGRDFGRIGIRWPSVLRGPARSPGKIIEGVDEIIHLLEEIRPQSFIVGRAGVGLGDGRQVVAAGVAAQAGGLVVPAAERLDAFGLLLAERVPEIVEEAVRIGPRQAADELIAILDERRVTPLGVPVQNDLAEGERLDETRRNGPRLRSLFHGHRGLGLEWRAGHPCRSRWSCPA